MTSKDEGLELIRSEYHGRLAPLYRSVKPKYVEVQCMVNGTDIPSCILQGMDKIPPAVVPMYVLLRLAFRCERDVPLVHRFLQVRYHRIQSSLRSGRIASRRYSAGQRSSDLGQLQAVLFSHPFG